MVGGAENAAVAEVTNADAVGHGRADVAASVTVLRIRIEIDAASPTRTQSGIAGDAAPQIAIADRMAALGSRAARFAVATVSWVGCEIDAGAHPIAFREAALAVRPAMTAGTDLSVSTALLARPAVRVVLARVHAGPRTFGETVVAGHAAPLVRASRRAVGGAATGLSASTTIGGVARDVHAEAVAFLETRIALHGAITGDATHAAMPGRLARRVARPTVRRRGSRVDTLPRAVLLALGAGVAAVPSGADLARAAARPAGAAIRDVAGEQNARSIAILCAVVATRAASAVAAVGAAVRRSRAAVAAGAAVLRVGLEVYAGRATGVEAVLADQSATTVDAGSQTVDRWRAGGVAASAMMRISRQFRAVIATDGLALLACGRRGTGRAELLRMDAEIRAFVAHVARHARPSSITGALVEIGRQVIRAAHPDHGRGGEPRRPRPKGPREG